MEIEAQRLYIGVAPNREIPSHPLFGEIHQRLRDTNTTSTSVTLRADGEADRADKA